MESWLTSTPYPGMVLWIVLYISDYYMTLNAAKGFQEIGHFHFEGSFELTPQFQEDINKQRAVSRRHILYLAAYTLVILFVWWLFAKTLKAEWLYSIYLGSLILIEVAVHLRHFRNLSMVKAIKKEGGVEGDITYQKKLSYRISANELQTLAWLFFIVAVITYSPFFLGGVISCFGISAKHNAYAKRAAGTPKVVHADHS